MNEAGSLVYFCRRHRWAFVVNILFCTANIVAMLGNPVVVVVSLVLGFVLLTAYPCFSRGTSSWHAKGTRQSA